MDSKDFTIGILSTTAVILFVGLIIIHTRPELALASGLTASGGPYVLTVGSVSTDDEEVLIVIDAQAEKLIVYSFDAQKHRIRIDDRIELGDMRSAGQAAPTQKKPGRRRRP